MAKHTIKGYLWHVTFDKSDDVLVVFNDSRSMDKVNPNWALIREQSFEVEVPDDFDPRPQKIAALEQQLKDDAAAYQKRVTDTRRRLSELTAIEYVEAA